MQKKIENIVDRAIDRLNEVLPAGEPITRSLDTVLLGEGGRLDSMGFVNLVVALEDELEAQLGTKLDMAEELLAAGKEIRTVADLEELLLRMISASGAVGAGGSWAGR
jgi:acyl carrier protein